MFNRENSTLGIMDDLQIAIHTYDGCSRGCPGCVVDKHFKNKARFENILSEEQMNIIHSRVKEELLKISKIMDAEFKVFSTGPTEDISKFYELTKPENNPSGSRFFLEIIYDPIVDKAEDIKNMILEMRKHNILGYPEILITQRLLSLYSDPKKFVDECVVPLGQIETQMQFGRYSPSKTRSFNTRQVVPLDVEVEWLKGVAYWITQYNLNIHPIPIGEYAVTFLDEYNERSVQKETGEIDEILLESIPEEPFNIKAIKDKTRDIFLTSLYIDHNLDLFVWSESMGQHVLDTNFGFPSLGNIKDKSISEIISNPDGVLEKMLNETIRHLMLHKKCAPCRYKSFCASHAIPFFRKFHDLSNKY